VLGERKEALSRAYLAGNGLQHSSPFGWPAYNSEVDRRAFSKESMQSPPLPASVAFPSTALPP